MPDHFADWKFNDFLNSFAKTAVRAYFSRILLGEQQQYFIFHNFNKVLYSLINFDSFMLYDSHNLCCIY